MAKRKDGFTERTDGRWTRKVMIDGKAHYATDPSLTVAKRKYKALKAKQQQAKINKANNYRTPISAIGDVTVHELCERYTDSVERKVNLKERERKALTQAKRTCKRLIEVFGRKRKIDTLRVPDFSELARQISPDYSPQTRRQYIYEYRRVFNWAMDNEVTERTFKFGDELSAPPRERLVTHHEERKAEAKGKFYRPEEIRQILDEAKSDGDLYARILFAVNTGYTEKDLERLSWGTHLKGDGHWCEMTRRKRGGVTRRCYIWDETLEAIGPPKDNGELAFAPKRPGEPELRGRMTRVLKRLDLFVKGRVFRALRNTFSTATSDCTDIVIIDKVMGHRNNRGEMAHTYIGEVADRRFKAVAQIAHDWLFKK